MSDERDRDTPAAGNAMAPTPAGLGHEPTDVRVRPVVLAFVGLAIAAVLAQGLMYVLLRGFTAREHRASQAASPLAASYGRQVPPEPRLQVEPREDLRRLHAREEALLHNYAWVDRQAGVTRIPIDRAIELLATRGLPSAGATP